MPHSSSDIIVILPKTLSEIPHDSSNLSGLTLFYAMPKELVEKRPIYLELPQEYLSPPRIRKIHEQNQI